MHLNASYLAVAGLSGHVTLYKYSTRVSNPDDELANIPVFEIPISYGTESTPQAELKSYLRTKIGFRRQQGFQPELACLLFWTQRMPPLVTNVTVHAKNKILLFGTDESIVVVEFATRTLLLNMSLVDFYGTQDPFQRPPIGQKTSPKKANKGIAGDADDISAAFDSREKETSAQVAPATTPSGFTISKQATIDNPVPMSRSSSYSSLENLSSNEGISTIVVNEYAALSSTSSNSGTKSESQQLLNQVWLGTSYGSVIVLNTVLQLQSDSNQSDTSRMIG